MTLSSSWFWPDVSDRKNALAAVDESFWVTMLLAALAAVSTFIDFARDWQADDRLWGFAGAAFSCRRWPWHPAEIAHRSRRRIRLVRGRAIGPVGGFRPFRKHHLPGLGESCPVARSSRHICFPSLCTDPSRNAEH